jgi:hypothetical protein
MDRAELWGVALTVISGIAMTAGIIIMSATSSANALCNSTISRPGHGFGSATQTRCVIGASLHGSGVILVILGIVGILVAMGRLFGNSRRS